MTSRRYPSLSVPLVVTVFSWGFNFVALKLLYHQMTPPAAGLVRFAIMYAVLVAICAAMKLPLRYPKGETFRILVLGFIAMGVYMVFFLEGMERTDAAEGAVVLATAPIFTSIFAAIAGQEKFRISALIGALVAFSGVAMVVFGGGHAGSGKLIGDLLVLGSSALWAVSAVWSRPIVAKHAPFQVLTLSMPGALIVMLPYALLPTLHTDFAAITPLGWLMMLHFAVMAGALGFWGFYHGVQKVGAAGAMLYQYFVSPIAALCAYWFLQTGLGPVQIAGMAVVVGGVAFATRARSRTANLAALAPQGGE